MGQKNQETKPKVKFLWNWLKFHEKSNFFRKRILLFTKKLSSYPPKFLMTFFSHQLRFSNIDPFGLKATDSSLLLTDMMYFSVKYKKTRKTQGPQEKTKNPRSEQKTQDLGRKPKEWQR